MLFYKKILLPYSQTPKNVDKGRLQAILFCANCASQVCAKDSVYVGIDAGELNE